MNIYFTHISQFSEQLFFEFGQGEVMLGLKNKQALHGKKGWEKE